MNKPEIKGYYTEKELKSFSDDFLIKIIRYHVYAHYISKEIKNNLVGFILKRQNDRYTKGDCFRNYK